MSHAAATDAVPAAARASEGRNSLRRFARVLMRFVPYMKPYWLKLVLILVITPLANTVITAAGPIFSALILDDAFPRKSYPMLVLLVVALLGTALLREAVYLLEFFVRYDVKLGIFRTLGRRFYGHLMRLPVSYHQAHPVGERVFRATVDVNDAAAMIAVSVPTAASMIIQGGVTALLTVLLDWRALVVVVLFLPPYFAFAQAMTNLWRGADRGMRERRQMVTAQLQQSLASVAVVQAYTREQTETRVYTRRLADFLRRFLQWQMMSGVNEGYIHPAGLASCFALLSNGLWGYFYITGKLTLGQWVALDALIRSVLIPSANVVMYFQGVRRDMVAAERVLEILDVVPAVAQPAHAVCLGALEGRIEVRDAAFGYNGGAPVLDGVSLAVEPGERIAILGDSGSGKSTLLALMLRFHDPSRGTVLADGHDLRTLALDKYRAHLGVVLQNPQLFPGSVRENLVYGCESDSGATAPENLREAAWIADCEDFIAELPQGMDTVLSEAGDLSGGQKQRLTIARALARRPAVLLFDEPFASLDSDTQRRILDRMRERLPGRTLVVATYHASLAREFDRIVVLDRGRVAETGNHATLWGRGGVYRRMLDQEAGRLAEPDALKGREENTP
jgi:ABC-type multidrug transport system fused ATPase/permease subunit